MRAAMRHPGGVAAVMLEERARRERRIVDFMANMLTLRFASVSCLGCLKRVGRAFVEGKSGMSVGSAKERLG